MTLRYGISVELTSQTGNRPLCQDSCRVPRRMKLPKGKATIALPLVGPNIIDEFIGPYYHAAWDEVDVQIFQLDSDGNIDPIVDALLRSGVNSVLPNEPAAGTDMVALRRKHGAQLKLFGGTDKFAPRTSREAIDAELEYKLQPLMREGGVVFGLDHRIPNGTPLDRVLAEANREPGERMAAR